MHRSRYMYVPNLVQLHKFCNVPCSYLELTVYSLLVHKMLLAFIVGILRCPLYFFCSERYVVVDAFAFDEYSGAIVLCDNTVGGFY